MKPLFTFLLLGTFISSAISQVYVWPTVDPYVPYHSIEYYESAKGYSKKVKESVIERNKDAYEESANKLQVELRRLYAASCEGISFANSFAPVNELRENSDIFVDLSCGLSIKKNEYPFYRTNNLNLSPEVFYQLKVYDAAGKLIGEKHFTEVIDYKKEIKAELQNLSSYEYDAGIFQHALLKSFKGKALKEALSYLCSLYKGLDKDELKLDQKKLSNSLSLVLDNRKSDYPGYYQKLNLAYAHSSPKPEETTVAATETYYSTETSSASVDPEMAQAFQIVREESKNWALIIGVNKYRSEDIKNLIEPINDARNLAAVLLSKYDFYAEETIILEDPTREKLVASLDYLSGVVRPMDNLLIFYAGHGLWDEGLEKGYWMPSDATTQNRANWFSNSDLRDYISGIKSHHTLLITDACFGGGIFKTRDAFSQISPATLELYKLPSRKAMTSGAMTTVPDKSVFIAYLLKRLVENDQVYLSSEQLFASFKIAVINNSPTKQVPQFGEIREAGDEGGDFLFILK